MWWIGATLRPMWKPAYTLFSLIAVALLCACISLLFPSDGIAVTEDYSLQFAGWMPDAEEDSLKNITIGDVEAYLESFDVEVDSVALKDSIMAVEAASRQALMRIQFPDGDPVVLHSFFEKLANKSSGEKVRVLHYGDSQIEGDRISGYVRNELQNRFGGKGPGLLPAFEVIPTLAIKQADSGNWTRHTRYGRKDTTVTHKDYGVLMTFSRFTPSCPDSLVGDSVVDAWFSYAPNRSTYNRNKKYTQATLLYGGNRRPCNLQVFADDVLIHESVLEPNGPNGRLNLDLGGTPSELKFALSGSDSPNIYGVSLEAGGGLYLDNIGMRGSSGTIFKKVSKAQLSAHIGKLNNGLYLLQFGGNYVPHIKEVEVAERYGKWFESQIRYLQSIEPDAAVIVIGPSDMAVKDGTAYVTRPFLEDVRDALKQAAFNTGSGFWDMYEVMGGRNSMVSWVEAEPALAAKDYTHFTPKGARRIAELFVRAINLEYDAWRGVEPEEDPVEAVPDQKQTVPAQKNPAPLEVEEGEKP